MLGRGLLVHGVARAGAAMTCPTCDGAGHITVYIVSDPTGMVVTHGAVSGTGRRASSCTESVPCWACTLRDRMTTPRVMSPIEADGGEG